MLIISSYLYLSNAIPPINFLIVEWIALCKKPVALNSAYFNVTEFIPSYPLLHISAYRGFVNWLILLYFCAFIDGKASHLPTKYTPFSPFSIASLFHVSMNNLLSRKFSGSNTTNRGLLSTVMYLLSLKAGKTS